MTDRKKLEEALARFSGCNPAWPLDEIILAAEARLATLPKPKWKVTAYGFLEPTVSEWETLFEANAQARELLNSGSARKVEIESP